MGLNIFMIISTILVLICYTKRSVDVLNKTYSNVEMFFGLLVFVGSFAWIIYGIFFYHWS